jgi:hypothetical protein
VDRSSDSQRPAPANYYAMYLLCRMSGTGSGYCVKPPYVAYRGDGEAEGFDFAA